MENKLEIYDFLKSNGFKLTEHKSSNFFGDYYNTFSNNVFQLRFNSSKSIETIEIRSIGKKEGWYDVALVKALLNNEVNLNKVTTIKEYSEFMKNELDRIIELFNRGNYPVTKKKLNELGNKRAKQMFPGMIK